MAIRKKSSNTILVDPSQGTIGCFLLQNLLPPEDGKSLWIKGPSGIGKTTWALKWCKKPCLFVTHMDTLQEFQPAFHMSIVFDDMNFQHLPRSAQIHLLDSDCPRQIHIRYKTVTLPPRVQKIFLSNDDIFSWRGDDAITRRINKVFID